MAIFKRRQMSWLRGLLVLASVLATCGVVLPGCSFDRSGLPMSRWQCDGKLYKYGTTLAGAPAFTIDKHLTHPNPSEARWKPFWLGLPLYSCCVQWKPQSLPGILKGTYLYQLHRAERTPGSQNPSKTNATDYLLRFHIKTEPVDRVYIAFDERATSVPVWMSEFELTSPLRTLTTTVTDDITKKPVKFDIYEPSNPKTFYTKDLLLGGNNATGVGWKPGMPSTGGEQYLIFVRMKFTINKAVKEPVDGGMINIEYDESNCDTSSTAPPADEEEKAIEDAIETWLSEHPDKDKDDDEDYELAYYEGRLDAAQNDSTCKCVQGTSSSQQKITASDDGLERYINSWFKSSVGAIEDSTSKLSVKVIDATTGQVTGSGVSKLSGEIEFQIDTSSDVKIGELTMYGEDVTLSDGTALADISIGQDATIVAECDDGLPPGPFRLCQDYMVPLLTASGEPGFQASAFCTVDGNDLPVKLENASPMPLMVDRDTKEFLMVGGPLEGSFTIDTVPYLVRININMGGHFTELAPAADIAETLLTWECRDGGVADVTLDASTSDDELFPGTLVAYKWVEDPGALTEKVLSTKVVSDPITMAFGTHDLALYVKDSSSIWNSLDFKLKVTDSKIDSVNPPADVSLSLPAGSTGDFVNVGSATADDICSGQVRITNDARATNWYPKGLSVVTWRFDDCHANIVEHAQKIFIVSPPLYPPPLSFASVEAGLIGTGHVQVITHETQSQGRGMFLDEYIVIYGPDDTVASIDSGGEIANGVIVAHATDATFGAEPTSQAVFEGVFSDSFSEHGEYVVETSLVEPDGDPGDLADVVARDWASFTFSDES